MPYKIHLIILFSMIIFFNVFLFLDSTGKYEQAPIGEYYSLTNKEKCYSLFKMNKSIYGLIQNGPCNPNIMYHRGNFTKHMYFKENNFGKN